MLFWCKKKKRTHKDALLKINLSDSDGGAVVGGAFKEKDKKKISVTSKGANVEDNTVLLPGEML